MITLLRNLRASTGREGRTACDAADGVWRAAFAFDPERKAVILVAADKSGKPEKAFYKKLIRTADTRYKAHLAELRNTERE
jgi:hypothetical protein